MFNQNLDLKSQLGATVIRKDGSHRDIDNLSTSTIGWKSAIAKIKEPLTFWQRAWFDAKRLDLIPVGLTAAGLAGYVLSGDASSMLMSLVTTAGVNYMAADFLSASSSRVNGHQKT